MGNETSTPTIDQGVLLPEVANIPLDNPDVDKRINLGTTAPNCQPKHTREALKQEARRTPRKQSSNLDNLDGEDLIDDESSSHSEAKGETGLEIVHDSGNGTNRVYLTNESKSSAETSSLLDEEHSKRNKIKTSTSKSSLSSGDDGSRSEVDTDTERKRSNSGLGKMSYLQMAKLGYQELVNAIIRPPRADYKVRFFHKPCYFSIFTFVHGIYIMKHKNTLCF